MKLKEKNRIVVQLYYYEGYSVKEIAEILRIKRNNSSNQINESKKCFKRNCKGGLVK